MRIVFLCTSSLIEASPRGRWLPIAKQLARQGHTPYLLMLHPTLDQLTQRVVQQDGVHIIYVDQMHVYGYEGQRHYYPPHTLLLIALRSALALAAYATRLRPHVIHIAKPQPINGLAGLLARHNGPLYLDCDDYETEANRYDGRWQQAIVRWWDNHLPPRVDAVSVNTRFSYDRCRNLGVDPARLFYVPNGASDWQYQRPPQHHLHALRQALGLHENPTILYTGAMNVVARGIGLLLEAFALLHTRMPAARLLMVGDGDDRLALQQQAHALGIGKAVRWTGRVDPMAIRAYLSLSDCSVDPVDDTPAMRGRSPLKIFESLALGVPVVTGDVGDRREILADGQAGILVAPGDPQALASGMEQVLRDSRLHQQLAHTSLQRSQLYRWERLVQDWVKMYD